MNSLKLLLFVGVIFIALGVRAEIGENLKVERFYTHLTTPARTIDQGHLTFETFPGAHGHTSFLVNSFSVGVFNWLQVGTVPLFYFLPGHRWNANVKVNFLREKYFQIGAGYSRFSVRLTDIESVQEEDGSTTKDPRADLSFAFLALNYREPSSRYAFGVNFTHLIPTSNSELVERILREHTNRKEGWGLDCSFDLNEYWTMTAGLGESRIDLFELRSPHPFGYGLSASYKRETKWITRVTGGLHYMPSENRLGTLFSFDL